MTQYGMVIDVKRCVACSTCVTGCKVENNLPQNMWWNRVVNEGGENPDSPSGTYEKRDLKMSSYTLACQHCSNPACVAVCPAGATWKDEETGIVLSDTEKCIGCGMCLEACPYDVRTLQDGEPAFYADFGFGAAAAPKHVAGTVEKCTLCHHRVTEGDMPFCVEVCPGRARVFGDLDDPESEVAKLVASGKTEALMAEAGTEPNVYLMR